ncbi:glutamate mutase L [Actinokineospora sp. HUAS TT18]|uniref:glutamate mutase L n=1 Tax=Actinokineospora sp. HUAS TT18 TaxID=3447451 RepID=UPI003F52795C
MPLLCLDVGSTWTKGALVAADGTLLGTAQHATTPPEVLDGVAAVTTALAATDADVLACSSAGGGLRLAVVGQERLVSAEAGYRVALSAGAKVVHVSSGDLDGAGLRELRADRPDVILLVGGTDGGDQRVLLHNARRLGANRVAVPIVLAGNIEARDEALGLLAGRKVVATDNVLPDVGELAPGPARSAIRSVFLSHVIGGKGLSRGPRFRNLVRTVTPDAVLTGVSRLAGVLARDEEEGAVLVVDVGGATTDVYSAVSTVDGERATTVALPADRRTVEGDIGMRWSAPGIVAEAVAERLIAAPEDLAAAAKRRAEDVDFIPTTADESEVDIKLASFAAILAVRRHLRLVEGNLGPKGAGLLVLSGGVFRHASPAALVQVEETLRADPILRPVLKSARVVVDRSYVLAPAGLLADAGHGDVADRLLERSL